MAARMDSPGTLGRAGAWANVLCRTPEVAKREYQKLRRQPAPAALAGEPDESFLALELRHANYGHVGAREELRRVLRALALRYRPIGFNPDLAILASLLLATVGREADAYSLLVGAVEHFDLQPFCVPALETAQGRHILDDQVYDVLASFSILCPKTVAAIKAQSCERQLEQLVARWFSSLFCCGCHRYEQPFETFCLFLDKVITEAPESHDDPHSWLRHVALSILLLNSARMNSAAREGLLQQELEHLERHIPVSDALLDLLTHPLQPRQMAAFTRLSFVPFGMLCGWSTGMMLSYDLGLTSLPLGALCSLGCFLGGAVVYNCGIDPGYSSMASLFKSLVTPHDLHSEEQGLSNGTDGNILWRENASAAELAEERTEPEPSDEVSDPCSAVDDFLST
ncbi:unnamed protein product, partial [Symbiodinium sp. CCMP2456]